jgi:hypothetical protein
MRIGSSERYFNSIVQICKENSTVVGAGVVVDGNTVITCSHVVAAALGLSANSSRQMLRGDVDVGVRRTNVEGAASLPRACHVIRYFARELGSSSADIAVLELKSGSFDLSEHPIATLVNLQKLIGMQIAAFGFPLDATDTIDQTIPAIYNVVATMPNGWLSATADQLQGQEIRSGFSGAPVMNRESGALVGIVCEADAARRTATIIPTRNLLLAYPLVLEEEGRSQLAGPFASEDRVVKLSEPGARSILEMLVPRLHYFLTVRLRLLPDPPERPLLQDYILDRKAIWTDELANKTYLPPPAKQLGETPAQMAFGRVIFFSPIQQLIREIAGLSSGGDAASAQISALSKRSRRVRDLIDRLLSSTEPLIVLGEPGSGKSMTLKQAGLALTVGNSKRVFPSLCVYVPLGVWRPPDKPAITDVERLVESTVPLALRRLILPLADQGRLVVIFDGLDEMSRDRYTPQTEALSRYAEKYRGRIHTLFSCRIADFSPAFRHRRLVLLPFGRRQIKEYLTRQFGNTVLEVSGRSVSVGNIAKYLDSEHLPVQPQNPFSLWLLSLYLREEREWPDTRVNLLRFLYHYQFERKRAEAEERGEAFPDEAVMLSAWGRLARTITTRNRGSDIGSHEVRQIFGTEAKVIISTGRTCGVLQESLEHDPPLVRFEHQRAQEYFTAFDIVAGSVPVDWEGCLDVPRWQETLVNVVQMEGGQAPLSLLGESLSRIYAGVEFDQAVGFERVEREALAGERLELASRVYRVVTESPERERFGQELRKASAWLGQNGNPVSVVKVLRVAQEVPHLELFETVKGAIKHKVAWVREQAQVVAVTLARQPAASPLPESIASAFSDGSILRSQAHYFRISKQLKAPIVALMAVWAALGFLLQACAVASVVPLATRALIHHVDWDKFVPSTQAAAGLAATFFAHWMLLIVVSTTLFATIGSLTILPKTHWFVTPAAGGAAFVLTAIIYYSWLWAAETTVGTLVGTFIPILFVLVYLGFMAFGVFSLTIFLLGVSAWLTFSLPLAILLSIWTADLGAARMTYRTTWLNGGYSDYIHEVKGAWGYATVIAVVGTLGWLASGVEETGAFHWLSTFLLNFPLAGPLLSLVLTVLLALLALVTLYWSVAAAVALLLRKKIPGASAVIVTVLSFGVIYLLFGVMPIVQSFVFEKAMKLIDSILGRVNAEWLIKSLVLISVLTITIGVLFLLSKILRPFWLWCRFYLRSGDVHFTEEDFRSRIAESSPEGQAELLGLASPDSLNMNAHTFMSLLIDLEAKISEDPALGRYWAKRAEVQDLLRQERTV